jgi:hypothetical protein
LLLGAVVPLLHETGWFFERAVAKFLDNPASDFFDSRQLEALASKPFGSKLLAKQEPPFSS